jgi:predicted porin
MNKKLIATAMSLALAGGMGLANADVKLYGQLTMSVDATDGDNLNDDVNMESTQSAIGFKGGEDLGNGMQAIFKVEYQADIDDTGSWTGRDQYIGFKTDGFGQLIFGTMSTAYKSASVALDPFYRMSIQAREVGLQSVLHSGKGDEGEGRATDTIRYDSPTVFGGLGLTATYTLDNDEGDGEDDDPYSVGLTYTHDWIYAFASYITNAQGGDDDAWQVGAKGDFGNASVWAMYEGDGGLITTNTLGSLVDTYFSQADCEGLGGAAGPGACDDLKSQLNGEGDSHNIWNVGASYKISNNLLSASYGQADDHDFGGGVKVGAYDAWNIGAQHMFSDRTRVFLGYGNRDYDGFGEVEVTTLGMRHNF